MIDNLKKYWFVVVICLVLVVGIGVFATKQMKSVVPGKKADGKQVVSEIAGINYFADDYFTDLKKRYGNSELYKLFERSILTSIDTSKEIADKAKSDAETVKKNVAGQQGQAGIKSLTSSIIALGYNGLDDLKVVYEDMAKRDDIVLDYLNANKDTYLKTYTDEKSPRTVSHILIKMADPKNPTAAETEKLEKAKAKLAAGEKFEEVATAVSDDEGSAVKGGSIGFMDKDSKLVPEFIEAAVNTQEGQLSDWFASSYGMHIVKVDGTTTEKFAADPMIKSTFIQAISQAQPEAVYQAIWEKAKSLEISFKDDAVKQQLLDFMKIKEAQ